MRPVLPDDPAGLRAWRDATLYRLVTRASEAEMRETLSRLRQRGYQDVTNSCLLYTSPSPRDRG